MSKTRIALAVGGVAAAGLIGAGLLVGSRKTRHATSPTIGAQPYQSPLPQVDPYAPEQAAAGGQSFAPQTRTIITNAPSYQPVVDYDRELPFSPVLFKFDFAESQRVRGYSWDALSGLPANKFLPLANVIEVTIITGSCHVGAVQRISLQNVLQNPVSSLTGSGYSATWFLKGRKSPTEEWETYASGKTEGGATILGAFNKPNVRYLMVETPDILPSYVWCDVATNIQGSVTY